MGYWDNGDHFILGKTCLVLLVPPTAYLYLQSLPVDTNNGNVEKLTAIPSHALYRLPGFLLSTDHLKLNIVPVGI
jgi:hypothetical protein